MSRKISIDNVVLKTLYWEKGMSTYQIGRVLGCSPATVANRLKEFRIPRKSTSFARTKYLKKDFDGSDEVRAYMMGFALGDLNVYMPKYKGTETVVARCHTTQKVQLDVITSLFSKYGGIRVSFNETQESYQISCFLNTSFKFLLDIDRVSWKWVAKRQSTGFAFISGYTDAEGNYILNQGRARFKIDSYDVEVLSWMAGWLFENGIDNKFRLLYKKGESTGLGGKSRWNKDLWRLNINKKASLYKFILNTMPYSHHYGRRKGASICLRNINRRTQYV